MNVLELCLNVNSLDIKLNHLSGWCCFFRWSLLFLFCDDFFLFYLLLNLLLWTLEVVLLLRKFMLFNLLILLFNYLLWRNILFIFFQNDLTLRFHFVLNVLCGIWLIFMLQFYLFCCLFILILFNILNLLLFSLLMLSIIFHWWLNFHLNINIWICLLLLLSII